MRSMRWVCDRDGCFNTKMRLRLGVYDHCFPGAIGLSDVDGAVELNGYFLWLEWKASPAPVPTGQRIMFERLTAPDERFTVFVVEGDPATMTPRVLRIVSRGSWTRPRAVDHRDLCMFIERWARSAAASPALGRPGPSSG